MGRPKSKRNSKQQRVFEARRRARNAKNQRRKQMKFRKPKTLPKTAIERVNKYRKKNIKSDNLEHYLGAMNVECCHCGALHFAKEKVANKIHPLSFGDCCSHGAVPRASFHDFPLQLKHLFERKHEFSS